MTTLLKYVALLSFIATPYSHAVSYVVGEGNNPETGGSGELFYSTAIVDPSADPPLTVSYDIEVGDNGVSYTLTNISASLLGYIELSGTDYFTVAFDLNEILTNSDFQLTELRIVSGSLTLYDLDTNEVTFNPVLDDPLVAGTAPVEFHTGEPKDIDAVIFIPTSVLTLNNITATDELSLTYTVSSLVNGFDTMNFVSDGSSSFSLAPEPSSSLLTLLGSVLLLGRRRRN